MANLRYIAFCTSALISDWTRKAWDWLREHARPLQALAAIVAIIVGFVSFFPGNEPEPEPEQKRNVVREIEFRVTQVDEILQNALEARSVVAELSDNELVDVVATGRLSPNGMKLQRLFKAAPQLKVVADLGGIGSAPRIDDNATVWIGGSGWSNSHLPRGRGFRSGKFKNFSLLELWGNHSQLTSGEPPNAADLSKLRAIFRMFDVATKPSPTVAKLPRIGSNGLTMREWSERTDLATIKKTTKEVTQWVESVSSAWDKIKRQLPGSNHS